MESEVAMNTRRTGFLLIFCSILLVVFSGCYTQFATNRGENGPADEEYTQDDNTEQKEYSDDRTSEDEGSYYTNEDDWQYRRPHVGFSYYYPSYYWPSTAFVVAYSDPWFYDCYWGYDPYWSPPRTFYPGYYYSHYYYNPYYSYYPYYPYYYGGGYSYYSPAYRNVRNSGSVRAGGGDRTGTRDGGIDRSGFDRSGSAGSLPTGSSMNNSGGNSSRSASPTVREGARREGNSSSVRSGSNSVNRRRSGAESRGSNTRRSEVRANRYRDIVPKHVPSEESTQAPPASGSSTGGRQGTGTRDSGKSEAPRSRDDGSSRGTSYTPPPSKPPASAPAPAPSPNRSGSAGSRGSGRKP